MATKKKAAKVPEPGVVEVEALSLHTWASGAISVAKVYRAGATSGGQRAALDELLVRLRAVLSEA